MVYSSVSVLELCVLCVVIEQKKIRIQIHFFQIQISELSQDRDPMIQEKGEKGKRKEKKEMSKYINIEYCIKCHRKCVQAIGYREGGGVFALDSFRDVK